MKKPTLKSLALANASVVALGAATIAGPSVLAQTSETIQASLTTSGTLTSTKVSDFDFGEFFILIGGGDTPTLTMDDNGNVAVVVAGDNNSTVTELVAPTTRGEVTVTGPVDGLVVTMTRSATTDFGDAGLTLSAVEYATATEGNGNAINADGNNGNVTIVTANTPETVSFGGVVTAGPQPANATHTAQFDVTFSF
jgi:hypothetical protein